MDPHNHKKTRKVWSGSEYFSTLKPHVKKRYLEKITQFCDGEDPYQISEKLFLPVHDKQGLGEGSKVVPPIMFPDLYMYLIQQKSAYTNEDLKNYKSLLAYDQFICGFVRDVKVTKLEKSSNVIIKCLVMHSQRLNEKCLHVWTVASAKGTIFSSHCDCMAGLDECCTHIAALLFYVECGVRYRESVTVTGVKAYWSVPTVKKVTYAPVCQLNLTSANKRKANFDAVIADGKPSPTQKSNIKKTIDVPPLSDGEWFSFTQTLHEINPNAALFKVLPVLQDQFKPKKVNYPPILTELFNNQNLPFNELLEHCDSVEIIFTNEEAKQLELHTKEQSKCKLWQIYRAGRITASNLRKACHSNPVQPSISLISNICNPASNIFETPATKWGIAKEKKMVKIYCNISAEKHEKFKFERAGLFLNPRFPHLGASPDGLIECNCCGKGLLEIKCPFSLKENTSRTISPKSCLEETTDGIRLKKDHAYYYQVQAQIFLTERQYCDFCIWTPIDHYIERIYADHIFWEDKNRKAELFFKRAILPELCGKYYSSINTNAPSNSKRRPTSPLKRSPTKIPQLSRSPTKIPQLSRSPTKIPQLSSSPTKIPQSPKSPTKIPQPPKSPTKKPQPPKSPIKIPQPPKSPIKIAQPPKSPIKIPQPPKSPIKIAQPPKSPIKIPQPPKSPIKIAQPPKSPIKIPQPPKSPIKIAQPPKSPIKIPQPPRSTSKLTKPPAPILSQGPQILPMKLSKSSSSKMIFTQASSTKKQPKKSLKKKREPLTVLSPNKKKIQTPKLWCYCKQEEGNELMIGCDRDDCKIQWFHAVCLKIDVIKSGKWFCPDCSKQNKIDRAQNRTAKKINIY